MYMPKYLSKFVNHVIILFYSLKVGFDKENLHAYITSKDLTIVVLLMSLLRKDVHKRLNDVHSFS